MTIEVMRYNTGTNKADTSSEGWIFLHKRKPNGREFLTIFLLKIVKYKTIQVEIKNKSCTR